jgi:hypothetical protein
MARQPLGGLGRLIFPRLHDQTLDTSHSVGLLWTRDQLFVETSTWQHSQETAIHALGGIRTHNPSKRAALDRAVTGIGQYRLYHLCIYKFFIIIANYCTVILFTPTCFG